MAARAPRELPPPAQVKQLEAQLASAAALSPAYLLRGDEPYFRQRATDALVGKAKALGAEVLVHDPSDPDFDGQMLLADLSTAPMFAASQLLVARGVEGLLTKQGKGDAPLTRAVLAFLERADPGRCLLLSVGTLRADHAVAKAVAKGGGAVVSLRRLYDSPPPWNPDPRQTELVQWCLERARELRVPLDSGQALYVAAATGNDLAALDTQLERLRVAGGDPRKAVVWQSAGSPFTAADAMCRGDLPRSLAALAGLFQGGMVARDGAKVVDEGALAPILLGALLRAVRQVLEGGGEEEDAGGPAGRARAELEARIRSRPHRADWHRMLSELLDLDRRAKSGSRLDEADFAALAVAWRIAGTERTPAARAANPGSLGPGPGRARP